MAKRLYTVLLSVVASIAVHTYMAGAACPIGDLTGDCRVDWDDLGILVEQWLGPEGGVGDLNGDEEVGMGDFVLLAVSISNDSSIVEREATISLSPL